MTVFVEKINSDKDLKSVVKGVFESLKIKPNGCVFVKPNLSARPPIEPGENTSIVFVKALAEVLLSYKSVEKIIFGHSSLLGTPDKFFPYDQVMESSGFTKLKDISDKIELWNLDDVKRREFKTKKYSLNLPEFLYDGSIDFYINVGAFKTHMETTVSFSLKNQMGLLGGNERRLFHHSGELEKRIADIAVFAKPDINFIDGLWAMEGNGPHHGEGKKMDLILAGDDMVEVDSLASALIGLDYKNIEHVKTAEELGVGKFISVEKIKEFEKFKVDFKLARKFIQIGKNIFVWPTDACSRCITALNESGKIYKKSLAGGIDLFTKAD